MNSTIRTLTPAAREFADACHSNRIEELEAALRQRAADRTDCETWGITPSQWRLAIQTALSERQGEREFRASAARALRAIPSEARSEQSRSNGRRGGRPARYILVDDLGRAVGDTVTVRAGRTRVEYGWRGDDRVLHVEGIAKLVRPSDWSGGIPERHYDA